MVPVIATDRFTLRPIALEDTAGLFPTLSDPGQCEFLSRPPFEDEAELAEWLFDPDWTGRTWIATDREGRVVARLVAVPGHEDGVAEIGYIVCREDQRRGIAAECAAALLRHLFNAEGHRKVFAEVDVDNIASVRLLERLGFRREALFREHETTHRGLCDVAIYALLRREFRPGE